MLIIYQSISKGVDMHLTILRTYVYGVTKYIAM